MLSVTPYAPKPRVVFYGRRGRLDVTPEDLLSVNTRRGLGESTGVWDLRLTGRRVGGKTYLDMIDTMDYVEIEMARTPSAGGTLTTVLRGFVDNVTETISGNTRRIVVNGRDYGKLLLAFQVYYLTEIDPAASLIQQAGLEVRFGIPGGILSPRQFVTLVGSQIVKPNLAVLQAENPAIPDLAYDVQVPDRFAVNGLAIQPFTGSVYNLLTQYASRPWIETFVEDRASGPTFVYRFAPLRTLAGARIGDYSPAAASYRITPADIESISLGRSDNEVRSYYFTYPVYSLLDRDAFKGEGLDMARNPYVDKGTLARYGFQPMEIGTTLIPSLAGDPADLSATMKPETIALAAELNEWLWKANRENHRLMNGSMTIKGGAGIRPGMDLIIDGMRRACYVSSVAHAFDVEGGIYRTQLGVVRGRDT